MKIKEKLALQTLCLFNTVNGKTYITVVEHK